jgi:hypothetical protein
MAKKSKAMCSEPMIDDKWKVESAARTLMDAEKVRGDKALFSSAKKELAKMAEQAKKAAR